jgi:hypothetical protein
LGGSDESLFVGNIGIVGARPVTVPWRLGFLATTLANLGRKIVRVKSGVGPRGAMYDAFQCCHLWPEVKCTEFLAGVKRWCRVGSALSESVSSELSGGARVYFVGEGGGVVLEDDGVF